MELLKFRDLKTRTNFETENYEIVEWNTKTGKRRVAKTVAPSGCNAFRILSKVSIT